MHSDEGCSHAALSAMLLAKPLSKPDAEFGEEAGLLAWSLVRLKAKQAARFLAKMDGCLETFFYGRVQRAR